MDRLQLLEARIAALEHALGRVMRQARMTVALSRTTAPAVDTGRVQTNQGRMDALTLVDGMPTFYHYGFTANLPMGSDKIVAFLNGDRGQGIVIATNHQSYRLQSLATGEVAIYDMWGRSVKLGQGGIAVQAAGAPINIANAGTMTVQTPLLQVSGDIVDNYATNTRTMASMRMIYDNHGHPVPNVKAGSDSATTAPPTQQM